MILIIILISRFSNIDHWIKSAIIILYYTMWLIVSQYLNQSYALEAVIIIDIMTYLWKGNDELIVPSISSLALIALSFFRKDDTLLMGALILFSIGMIALREKMKLSNLVAAIVLISIVFLPEKLMVNETIYYLSGIIFSISLITLMFFKKSKDFFGAEIPLLLCLIVGNMIHNKELFLYPFLAIWILYALTSFDKFDFIQMESGNSRIESMLPIGSLATYLALTDGSFFAMILSGACILISREIRSIDYSKMYVLLNVFLLLELFMFSKGDFGALSYVLTTTIFVLLFKTMFHARFSIEKIIREIKVNYIPFVLILAIALLVQIHLILKVEAFKWFYSPIFFLFLIGLTFFFGNYQKIKFFSKIEKFRIVEIPQINWSIGMQIPKGIFSTKRYALQLLSLSLIKDRYAFNELAVFSFIFVVMLFLSMAVLLK